jgi:hypothetical protein
VVNARIQIYFYLPLVGVTAQLQSWFWLAFRLRGKRMKYTTLDLKNDFLWKGVHRFLMVLIGELR